MGRWVALPCSTDLKCDWCRHYATQGYIKGPSGHTTDFCRQCLRVFREHAKELWKLMEQREAEEKRRREAVDGEEP